MRVRYEVRGPKPLDIASSFSGSHCVKGWSPCTSNSSDTVAYCLGVSACGTPDRIQCSPSSTREFFQTRFFINIRNDHARVDILELAQVDAVYQKQVVRILQDLNSGSNIYECHGDLVAVDRPQTQHVADPAIVQFTLTLI